MSARAALRQRDFTLLWAGQATSQIGSRGYGLAIMLWVLAGTHSPVAVGAVTTVTLAAVTVAQVPAGWLADRYDRRRLMLASDAIAALGTGSLAVAASVGAFQLAHVFAVAAVLGIGWAVRGTAQSAALPRMVDADELADALALNQARGYATGIIGPLLAGVLFTASPILPFAVDAASYAVGGICTFFIRARLNPAPASPIPVLATASGSRRHELMAWSAFMVGVRAVWKQPFIRASLALAMVGEFVVSGGGLFLVTRLDRGSATTSTIGVVLSVAYGAGLLGALAVPALGRRVRGRTLLVAAPLGAAVGVLGLAAGTRILAGVGYAVVLLARPLWQVPMTQAWQLLAEDEIRGRVMGAIGAILAIAATVTPAVTGLLLDAFGPVSTVVLMALALTMAAVVTVTNQAVRAYPWQSVPSRRRSSSGYRLDTT